MVRVVHVEVVHIQRDVLLFFAGFMAIEAVLQAAGGKQEDQEYS